MYVRFAIAFRNSTGSLRFSAKIRALAGCTPGAASIKLHIWKEILPSGKN